MLMSDIGVFYESAVAFKSYCNDSIVVARNARMSIDERSKNIRDPIWPLQWSYGSWRSRTGVRTVLSRYQDADGDDIGGNASRECRSAIGCRLAWLFAAGLR